MKKIVEIVTSAYNEEECLPELFKRIDAVSLSLTNYEFLFTVIDNGSQDNTWKLIEEQCKKDSRYRGHKMSRNFSLDAAFTCGLDSASGDVVIIMTSDLQDPPESIPALLAEYEKGYDQVLAKIVSRSTVPFLRRYLSRLFYLFANRLTGGMLPESVSDFRLLSKPCYQAIRSLRESHRFIRGLGSWVGFKTTHIEIHRPPRFAGESKWLRIPLFKVIFSSVQSIFAYSTTPLAWVSLLGILLSAFSMMALLILVAMWFIVGVPFAGFGSIVALIVLGFSITILILGIIAQYLGLIYEEVKQRPLYIVDKSV